MTARLVEASNVMVCGLKILIVFVLGVIGEVGVGFEDDVGRKVGMIEFFRVVGSLMTALFAEPSAGFPTRPRLGRLGRSMFFRRVSVEAYQFTR